MNQAAFLDVEPAPHAFQADPNRVRARLNGILAEIKTATSLPWRTQRLHLYRAIVPQMSLWLPEEEARQFCQEFDSEVARLESLAAAA